MTLIELRKTKEELNRKRNELLRMSEDELDNVIRCQNNQFDTTITMRMAFSGLSHVGMITIASITKVILTRLGMANILLNIPKLLVLSATLIPSVIIGTYIDKRLTKGKKSNEFAKMTEEEKIEKELRHKIEIAKLSSKIEIIKETISKIEEKEKFMETNGEFYGAQTKNVNLEDTKKEIVSLSTRIDNDFKKLDILSKQSVLVENFKDERLKGFDKQKLLVLSLGYGVLATMYTLMPLIVLGQTFNGIAGLITFFGIYGVNATIFGGYCDYRTKMKKRVFKKLNKELCNMSLAYETNDITKEIDTINAKKETSIRDASIALGLLQEQKSLLEQVKEENSELTHSYENTNKFENTYNIENFEAHFEMDAKDGDESVVDGPTLVKRKQ